MRLTLDVVTAFIYALFHSPLPIYVRPSPGYEMINLLAWLLIQALYGLRQSARIWYPARYPEIVEYFATFGFIPLLMGSYLSFELVLQTS